MDLGRFDSGPGFSPNGEWSNVTEPLTPTEVRQEIGRRFVLEFSNETDLDEIVFRVIALADDTDKIDRRIAQSKEVYRKTGWKHDSEQTRHAHAYFGLTRFDTVQDVPGTYQQERRL